MNNMILRSLNTSDLKCDVSSIKYKFDKYIRTNIR